METKVNFQISEGLVEQALWLPSPNFNTRPTGGLGEISLLVIHNISLPPAQFGGGYVQQFFQNKLNSSEHPYFTEIAELKVSSHLFIDREGAVFQFVNLNHRAWHAGQSCYQGRADCNDYSIGIELEGTDTIAYTDKQYQTLIALTQALMQAYPKISSTKITGHEFIAPRRKTDPGASFDWQRLFLGIRGGRQ